MNVLAGIVFYLCTLIVPLWLIAHSVAAHRRNDPTHDDTKE